MLALSRQIPEVNSLQHTQHRSYHPSDNRNLHAATKSLGNILQGGLPTPPATADMSEAALINNHNTYRQQYPYVTDRALSVSESLNSQHAAYPSNGKAAASQAVPPVYTAGYTGTTARPEEQIVAHLQIPESVNSSKGSLAEFAAEMTCLFWFESTASLKYAESLSSDAPVTRGLSPGVEPTIGFRKWVTTILSTTQVGKNVILLALMFIYRLKEFNPDVSGKMGSEFRLLTIALMLGNKFLDDNTYTNKTWAEVSGISVNEIHIMEVEFLSNMKYQLYASEEQWLEWKNKLGKFGTFYDKARRYVSSKATSPVTPITQTIPHKLPSPPSGSKYLANGYTALPNPLHTLPQLPRSPARYVSQMEHPFERKRSLDISMDLPPAKRVQSVYNLASEISPRSYTPTDVFTPGSVVTPGSTNTVLSSDHPSRFPFLPMPNLPALNPRNTTQSPALALPGSRSMSSIYPSSNGMQQPPLTPSHIGPGNFPILPMPNGNTSRAPSVAGSAHTSPTNLYGNATPTRQGLSPSYFLQNRSSPYRPVRHVNTLLYPPPLTAMANPIKPIDYQQMHYQPIGSKGSDLRSGPMPCLQPDAWQSHAPTPVHQIYRSH